MPKRTDGTRVSEGFNFDGANTTTTEQDVTKILPLEDNKVDLGSPLKKFKNIYYDTRSWNGLPEVRWIDANASKLEFEQPRFDRNDCGSNPC